MKKLFFALALAVLFLPFVFAQMDYKTVTDFNEGISAGNWVFTSGTGGQFVVDNNTTHALDGNGIRLGVWDANIYQATLTKDFNATFGLTDDYNTVRLDYYTDQNWQHGAIVVFLGNTVMSKYFLCSFQTTIYYQAQMNYETDFINTQECTNTGDMKMSLLGAVKLRVAGVVGMDYNVTFDKLEVYKQINERGKIALTFDDAIDNQFTLGKTKMDDNHLKGTAYLIMNSGTGVNATGGLSQAQAQTMYSNGWDLGPHGATSLDSITLAAAITDINYHINMLDANGWTRAKKLYAYPGGVTTNDLYNYFRKNDLISLGRNSFSNGTSYQPIKFPFFTNSVSFSAAAYPILTLKNEMSACANNKQQCSFTFHQITLAASAAGSISTADFNSLIDFVANMDNNGTADIVTASQQYALLQGTINHDKTPPTSAIDYNTTWQTGNATLGITCTDTYRCLKTQYRLDTDPSSAVSYGAWTRYYSYDQNITISTDGNWAIDYNSTDMIGNTENTKTIYILIENTTPTPLLEQNTLSMLNIIPIALAILVILILVGLILVRPQLSIQMYIGILVGLISMLIAIIAISTIINAVS